ncbi:hypothetical protein MSAN_01041500 [Mycena sanguinolenta]|uniref:Uncharacterized protein n=1 Tax=Mycena sanguinolenta TaxID=230812 RepID=A0A8H7D740_9AGAR|nr:hypothetical protein MSAN_01041500 [Mycena sanguinolenta]
MAALPAPSFLPLRDASRSSLSVHLAYDDDGFSSLVLLPLRDALSADRRALTLRLSARRWLFSQNEKGAGRAMKRLQVVLKQIMLSKTKTQQLNGEALVTLPPRIVKVISYLFDPSEQAFYLALETKLDSVVKKI